MAESERDRVRREIAEINRRRREARDQAAYESAAAEERASKWSDHQAEKESEEIMRMLGGSLSELRANIDKDLPQMPTVRRAIDDIAKAQRKGQRSKARRIAKKNRKLILGSQKKKGCSLFALLLIVAVGGVVFGSYEGVDALVSAIA
jgi:hypothetical protein